MDRGKNDPRGTGREGSWPKAEIRELAAHEELLEVERIQREVWGIADLEIVGTAHLRAVQHAGGQLAGAFVGERMVGFSYGFLARPHGRGMKGLGLHSHMVAVRQEARGRGVGQALKHHQHAWCAAHRLAWITWTFDPLQANNARLNLVHLGAIGVEYLVDFYGPMGGPLGGGQPTDRLLALWRVARPGEAAGRAVANEPPSAEPVWALRAGGAGGLAEPLELHTGLERATLAGAVAAKRPVRLAVPSDITYLLAKEPELARRWRAAVGAAMLPLIRAGYAAVGFEDGAYVLEPLHNSGKRSLTD